MFSYAIAATAGKSCGEKRKVKDHLYLIDDRNAWRGLMNENFSLKIEKENRVKGSCK